MKNLISLLMLSGMFLFVGSSYADTAVPNFVKSEITTNEDSVSYRINLGDITNTSDAKISETIQKFIETNVNPTSEVKCSITVTFAVGDSPLKYDVSFTVSGPCNEIYAKGKKVADELIEEMKEKH